MERDDMSARQQFRQGRHNLHSQRLSSLRRDEWIKRHNLHPKHLRYSRHTTPNTSQANQSQCSSKYLKTRNQIRQRRERLPRTQDAITHHDPFAQIEQQGDRMFSGRLGWPIRTIHDQNTAPGRRVKVNAIYTDARASDDTQAWSDAIHHLTCHKHLSRNYNHVSRRCFLVPIVAFTYAGDVNAGQPLKYGQGRGLQRSPCPYMRLRHTRPFSFACFSEC